MTGSEGSKTSSAKEATPRQWRLSAPTWFYVFIPQKLGSGLTATLLPLFVVQVAGGNVADVGRVTALAALAGVPASIFWGNLSDRLGRRRPFLLLGFLGFATSLLLISLGHSVSQVLIVSTLGALFSTAIEPVASALVLDNVPEDRWPESLGRFNQIGGWSFVAGLLVGTAWLALLPGQWSPALAMRGLFLTAGGVASLSLALALGWLREPPTVRGRRRFHPGLIGRLAVAVVERALFYPPRLRYFVLRPAFLAQVRQHLRNALGRYYLCSLLSFFAIHVGFVPFPIFLTDTLGATNAQVFLISLIKFTIDALLYVPMGRVVQRRRGIGLLAQATAVRVGVFGLFALIALVRPGPIGLVVVAFVHIFSGVTWAAIAVSGTTAVAMLAPKGVEGRALGLYNAIIGAAGIAGSLAGGYLAQVFGYAVSFGTAALLMSLTAAWLWRLRAAVLSETSHPGPAQRADRRG
jgi:DHA1 family multidrug resistance protein-like MFS transporter